jgi:hypothetical protein
MKHHIRIGRALVGGVIGALAVSAVTGVVRLLGAPINFEMLLGSMLLGTLGPVVWLLAWALPIMAGSSA